MSLKNRIETLEAQSPTQNDVEAQADREWLSTISDSALDALIALAEVGERLGEDVMMSALTEREAVLIAFAESHGTELALSDDELAVLEIKLKGLL